MKLEEIETKLEKLRKEYQAQGLFQDKEIIKRRARALQIAKEKLLKKHAR